MDGINYSPNIHRWLVTAPTYTKGGTKFEPQLTSYYVGCAYTQAWVDWLNWETLGSPEHG